MIDCVRLHMTFNNLAHAQTAVAEGSFLVTSPEMKNAFRSELGILRNQISAGVGGSTSIRRSMEPEDWAGSRKWRFAVRDQQFAERVAKTDRAVRERTHVSIGSTRFHFRPSWTTQDTNYWLLRPGVSLYQGPVRVSSCSTFDTTYWCRVVS